MLNFSFTISNSHVKRSCLTLKKVDNQLADIPIRQQIIPA